MVNGLMPDVNES